MKLKMIVLGILVFAGVVLFMMTQKRDRELSQNLVAGIARVDDFKQVKNKINLKYRFVYKGKEVTGTHELKGVTLAPQKYIGKYYEVHFSSKDPKNSRLQLSKPVSSQSRIQEAGL